MYYYRGKDYYDNYDFNNKIDFSESSLFKILILEIKEIV